MWPGQSEQEACGGRRGQRGDGSSGPPRGVLGASRGFKVAVLEWIGLSSRPNSDLNERFHLCEPRSPHLQSGSENSHSTEVVRTQ